MTVSAFPYCCGIKILAEFGNTRTAINQTEFTPEEVKTFVTQQISYSKGTEAYGLSMLMVTLNNEQIEKLGSVFEELGFEIVTKNHHKSHNTEIYVLIKKL